MMNQLIYNCSCNHKGDNYCRLSPTCKGWGCKFLSTEIPLADDELKLLPISELDKPKLFSKVYREAKQKGVLECPHYRSMFIDEMLENISSGLK